jgi:hypothetical protein
VSLTISPAVTPTPTPDVAYALPAATTGTEYSEQLSVTGAVGAVTWSIVAGQLPPGIVLDPTTGLLYSPPVRPGGGDPFTPRPGVDGPTFHGTSASFVVQAADSAVQTYGASSQSSRPCPNIASQRYTIACS